MTTATENLKFRISHRAWRIALWLDRINFEQRAARVAGLAGFGWIAFGAGYYVAISQYMQ